MAMMVFRVKVNMCLHVHFYVSGPKTTFDLAAEFRYHIFSKEMPLVLKSVLYGDSKLFEKASRANERFSLDSFPFEFKQIQPSYLGVCKFFRINRAALTT